jgi:hypothetical protein
MINHKLLNSCDSGRVFSTSECRNPDKFLSYSPKTSSIYSLDLPYARSPTGKAGHANSGPPLLLKSLDRDIMLAERVADLARRHLEQARGLGLHPASCLHRLQQTFTVSRVVPVQDVASV